MEQTVDVSGLSAESISVVRAVVESLRSGEAAANLQRNPAEWAKALREWVESHPKRKIEIDDSRETIYAGRGE